MEPKDKGECTKHTDDDPFLELALATLDGPDYHDSDDAADDGAASHCGYCQ